MLPQRTQITIEMNFVNSNYFSLFARISAIRWKLIKYGNAVHGQENREPNVNWGDILYIYFYFTWIDLKNLTIEFMITP